MEEEIDFLELFYKDQQSKYQVLEHREQQVLYLRYVDKLTYDKIGKYINRNRETARRIQITAERKLCKIYVKNMSKYKDTRKGFTF